MGTHIYNKIMKSTNEIKVNNPYNYKKVYGESHSFIEYTKSAGETGQYADNFLINIPKAKIIAGFTGWNVPRWARKAEKGDSNFYIASRSAITNPPPYLSTPHIEINDPNSWEPATTAASLIMKYNKNDVDEIKVNDPTKKYIIHSYHNSFPYKEPETINVPPSQIKKKLNHSL
jgi:hypothetical protein